MSRLRPIPMIWYHYFQYENKGGGVKRVKKIANVDKVPAKKHSFIVHRYTFYNCYTSLGYSISYNHEKNKFQTLNAVFSVITIFGKKVNRSPEVNGQCPGYFYTTIMR